MPSLSLYSVPLYNKHLKYNGCFAVYMNFEKLAPVESSKVLLDIAFKKAREKEAQKKLQGTWIQLIKRKESLKLDIVKDSLVSKLEKVLSNSDPKEKAEDALLYSTLFQNYVLYK